MEKIIAIGPREQDFAYTRDFFSGSITLYGSGKGNNMSYCASRHKRINHNVHNDDQSNFINDEMLKLIYKVPDIKFMSYDPNQVYSCCKKIIDRTVCLNSKSIMDKMNDKISFREWAAPLCEVQISQVLFGNQCAYSDLCYTFPGYDSFVIQAEHGSGGEGTFLLNSENKEIVASQLSADERYLVSGYEKYNIPLNIHAIIYKDEILIFPPSIQIMRLNGHKLLYQGADFVCVRHIVPKLIGKFRDYMFNICKKLQSEGYRGVTGVDAMIVGNNVRILEMNNRFQGSTILLNKALYDAGLPSMPELNYEAFNNDRSSVCVENLTVPYSCFTYIADEKGQRQRSHYRDLGSRKGVVEIPDEGLNYDYDIAPYATLERVIFNSNIVSVSPENTIRIHPNIIDLPDDWVHEIVDKKNLLYIKIALINQGVHIPSETAAYFKNNGGMREGVYNAIDIYFDELVINAPVNVKFSDLSPFELKVENNSLKLCFIDEYIADVKVKPEDTVRKKKTSSGQKVGDICLLATDRIRVQHSRNCDFVRHNVGCRFCEVENHEFTFSLDDIHEAIDIYKNSGCEFRHFLIGGRSDSLEKEPEEIINIARHINKDHKYPIYVMCVPPALKEDLDSFYRAGVTEVAFNIEIWDRKLAKMWMPGKGYIPLSRYLDALKYAVTLWGNTGAVCSSFVVGLEPLDSLLEGITKICELGAAPILSVFRPIPGTVPENLVPLSDEELLDIYHRAKEICDKYGLELGPQCVPCQNNTLSLPRHLECGES